MDKLPPIEKIYEAYSAISDGRVSISGGGNSAVVVSSNRDKEYAVAWQDKTYASSDSASYWQGYPGYPILAVLMLQGTLTLDGEVAALFANVNWTKLNKKHKRDYAAAVDEVMRERHCNVKLVEKTVEQVYEEIKALDIVIKRSLDR